MIEGPSQWLVRTAKPPARGTSRLRSGVVWGCRTHDESPWRGLLTSVDAALIYALFGVMALTLVVLAVGGMRR
jgi:hypothetical protein